MYLFLGSLSSERVITDSHKALLRAEALWQSTQSRRSLQGALTSAPCPGLSCETSARCHRPPGTSAHDGCRGDPGRNVLPRLCFPLSCRHTPQAGMTPQQFLQHPKPGHASGYFPQRRCRHVGPCRTQPQSSCPFPGSAEQRGTRGWWTLEPAARLPSSLSMTQ